MIYNRSLRSLFFALFLSTIWLTNSEAQELRLSIADCIHRVSKMNPDVMIAYAEADKARMLQSTAFDIDKTELSLSQDPTSGGSPDNALTISQSFDFPTVYTARHRYLKSQTIAQNANARIEQLNAERDVVIAYYDLVYALRVCDILAKQDSVYARFLQIAKARQSAGATSRLELINAQRAVDDGLIKRQSAHARHLMAMAELQRLIATDSIICPTDSVLTPIADLPTTTIFNFEQTSVADAYKAQTEMSKKSFLLARQMFLPQLSIGLRQQLLIKPFNPYNISREAFSKGSFMGFEIGIGIPLFWGSTRAKAKAARRDVEIQQMREQNAKIKMQAEYQNAMSEYRRASLALDYYHKQGATQAEEMTRLSQASYEAGEIGYVEYLQNQTTAFNLLIEQANAIKSYNQAIVKLKTLLK